MKSATKWIAAGLIAASFVPAAHAAGLLGGLVNTGGDSGNGSGVVSNNSNGSIGVGGSNGVSVNPGGLGGLTGGPTGSGDGGTLSGLTGSLTGGSGLGSTDSGSPGSLVNGLSGGSGSLGLGDIASVSSDSTGGGVPNVGVTLLGGGGTSLGTGDLPGTGGSGTVNLPGLGGIGDLSGLTGTGGTNGTPGAPGAPGAPGGQGTTFRYVGGGGVNGVAIPTNITSRLRQIPAMLAARDWIKLVNGRAICLANVGVAEISTALPKSDSAGLNRALPQYANDIATLRQLLANCRSSK